MFRLYRTILQWSVLKLKIQFYDYSVFYFKGTANVLFKNSIGKIQDSRSLLKMRLRKDFRKRSLILGFHKAEVPLSTFSETCSCPKNIEILIW